AATKVTWTVALTSTLQGQSSDTGDVGFYYFTVGKQHILSLTTQTTAGATALVVLEDDAGNVIATTQPGTNNNKLRALVLPNRTYFLRVVSTADATASYKV